MNNISYLEYDYQGLINYVLEELKKKDIINDKTKIIFSIENEYAYYLALSLKENSYIVCHDDFILKDKIILTNANVITIPSSMPNEELNYMALDIKEEIDNSYILDLYKLNIVQTYFFKEFSKRITNQYDNIYIKNMLGSDVGGLAKYFKIKTFSSIYVIKRQNCELLFDEDLIDGIYDEKALKIMDNSLIIG